ncbi:hypothetical protein [Nonomuraea polychroma]|uniref:hypothetical protein n=1 Tax=Nonomuraea polychroma TaxID=46176 RepID=UPI000FDD010C|nr:hypothetical protein [Nonomuraea polychroma]
MAKSFRTAESMVRDVRQLFALVEIPERRSERTAGGYSITAFGDRVNLRWTARDDFEIASGEMSVDHPGYPLVRVERAIMLAMERAMAEVLYAAGLTLQLRPGVPQPQRGERARPGAGGGRLPRVPGMDQRLTEGLHPPGSRPRGSAAGRVFRPGRIGAKRRYLSTAVRSWTDGQ